MKKIKDDKPDRYLAFVIMPRRSVTSDNDGKVIGYAIDICNRIVDVVRRELNAPGLRVEVNSITSSTRIPLMTNGTVDLECGSTTNNAEHQKQVAFTNAHFVATSKYVAKKAQNLKTIDDLQGSFGRLRGGLGQHRSVEQSQC